MTKYHSKNIRFWLAPDGAAASQDGTLLHDVSSVLNTVDFPRTADEVDVTTFGAGDFRQFLAGFQNATLRIAGFWDDKATAAGDSGNENFWHTWSAAGTQQRMFRFAPGGSAAGKPYYQGTALILGFSTNGAVQNAIAFNTDLRVTGVVTRGTF